MMHYQKQNHIEYSLTDCLEMRYSKDQTLIRKVKQTLGRQKLNGHELHRLRDCFLIGDALLVIQNGGRQKIKDVILLDGNGQSFRVLR